MAKTRAKKSPKKSARKTPRSAAKATKKAAARPKQRPKARKAKSRPKATRPKAAAKAKPQVRPATPVTPVPVAAPAPATITADIVARATTDVPEVRGAGRTRAAANVAPAGLGGISFGAPPPRVRMVVMPPRGLRARPADMQGPVATTLLSLYHQLKTGPAPLGTAVPSALSFGPSVAGGTQLSVLDSIAENGAKLIEINPGEENTVRAALPGVRLVPEVFYQPLSVALSLESDLQPSGAGGLLPVTVRSAVGGAPVAGVKVVGFSNFALRQGAQAVTNAAGVATLSFGAVPPQLERLYAFPTNGFWGSLSTAVPTAGAIAIALKPIDLTQAHPLVHYFSQPVLTVGAGVKVGVLDTGSGPHPDLAIAGGMNAVAGQNPLDFGDNGDQHGTHVAGIIASRGSAPTGVRGVAPGVQLFSYRVFAQGKNASNFDIARAIDRARADGCDLINLSLGRPAAANAAPDEPLVRVALEDARDAGVLPIAAAGNDHRRGVSFPGADDLCVAVSALGDSAVVPVGTSSAATVMLPAGTIGTEFIADFSNVGPQLDLTGPGVGVVSTVPGGLFAVMDGTSMACPAVTGITARLLASNPAILNSTRDAARATAIETLLLATARTRGFTPPLEGRGLPG